MKIYVATGNMQEYALFLKEQILPPGTFQWLHSIEMLYGIENPVVITLGTWYKRGEFADLHSMVLSRWRPSCATRKD